MPSGIRRRKLAKSGIKVRRRARKQKSRLDFGDPLIAANWNPKETVAQNYRRLGLGATLEEASGGIEPEAVKPGLPIRTSKTTTARIVQGPNGPVAVYDKTTEIDIDEPLPKVPARTEVAKLLEERASKHKPSGRQLSAAEKEWLEALVAKHGDDYTAMQWDRKLNTFQHSAGELKRRIKKLKEL